MREEFGLYFFKINPIDINDRLQGRERTIFGRPVVIYVSNIVKENISKYG